MPDTKITALAAITTVDPAADVLPIVDISDTSMAASGTTKKITTNQILGAGGTATLASATITGDLTVRTNKLFVNATGVGVNYTSPAVALHVGTTGATNKFCINTAVTNAGDIQLRRGAFIGFSNAADNTNSEYLFANGGALEMGIAGTTAMTLNATGLGVGVVGANGIKLSSFVTTDGAPATSGTTQTSGSLRIGAVSTTGAMDMGTAGSYSWIQVLDRGNLATNYDLVLQKNGGNVGIGVQPSGKLEVQESGTGSGLGGIVSSTASSGGNAGYVFRTGGTNRWSLSITGSAGAESIRFYDINNSATRLLIDTSGNFISNVTGTAPTLATNSQMVFNLTSNTNLRISVRGSDGVTRVANITLA